MRTEMCIAMCVQIVTIGMIVSYVPTPVEWYTAGFPPIKFTMGYSELVSHLQVLDSTNSQ